MDKIISTKKLIADFRELQETLVAAGHPFLAGCLNTSIELVDKQLEVDAVEMVHGQWIDLRESSKDVLKSGCSVCGRVIIGLESEYNYCPNCGAKMDLDG